MGVVQVVWPSGCRVVVQPASCLRWWCLGHSGVRLAAFVCAAFCPGDEVVEFGASGVAVAAWSAAGAVSGDDVVGEVLGWPVAGAAVVDQPALFVVDQAVPGSGRVGGERAGGVR